MLGGKAVYERTMSYFIFNRIPFTIMDTANHTQLQIPKKGAVVCNCCFTEMAAILMILICLDDTVPPTDNALSQILYYSANNM